MKITAKLASVLIAVSAIAALSSCDPEKKDTTVAPPEKLEVVKKSDKTAELRWLGDAHIYEMIISPKPESLDGARTYGTITRTSEPEIVNGHSHIVTDLIAETTYTWKIRARRDDIFSDWVEGPEFTTLPAPTPTGFKVEFADIVDLPDGKDVKIKAFVTDRSTHDPVELASADYDSGGGGATLWLPETIAQEYLMLLNEDETPEGLEISDPDLKFTDIVFQVFDISDKMMGFLFFGDDVTHSDSELMYADRPCTITGTEDGCVWDIDLAKGYNWTQYINVDGSVVSYTNGRSQTGYWYYVEW